MRLCHLQTTNELRFRTSHRDIQGGTAHRQLRRLDPWLSSIVHPCCAPRTQGRRVTLRPLCRIGFQIPEPKLGYGRVSTRPTLAKDTFPSSTSNCLLGNCQGEADLPLISDGQIKWMQSTAQGKSATRFQIRSSYLLPHRWGTAIK